MSAQFKRFAIVVWLVFYLAGCASNDNTSINTDEQETYAQAQKYLDSKNWLAAITALEYLEENFPFGRYAEQAQLDLIYAYHKSTNQDLAYAAADRFIRLHPQHRNVDYAYYMRGVANFNRETAFISFVVLDVSKKDPGTAREAFDNFAEFIQRFPNSPYAADARLRMLYLRNILARAEIHVANYYFRRGAYIAAANRGRFVVENMQGSLAVPDGLAVMAQAYKLLDMEEASHNAAKVLESNFPDHPAIKEGKFDYQFGLERKRSWFSYATFGLFDKNTFVSYDSRKVYNPIYKEATPSPPADVKATM